MKSMFRQLVTLSLSLAMCLLMIPGASAASYQIGDVTIETGMSDPHQIQPRAVVYYEKVSDATFFPFSIGCKPQNGHVMVLTIENLVRNFFKKRKANRLKTVAPQRFFFLCNL